MRRGARRRAGEGRRVSRGSRQAFWILRRRGDEGDGREGKSQSDQRHPAKEARRLTNGAGYFAEYILYLTVPLGVVSPTPKPCTPLSQLAALPMSYPGRLPARMDLATLT